MFVHLFEKTYLVNESNRPKPWDPDFLIADFEDIFHEPDFKAYKDSFATVEMMFQDMIEKTRNPKRSLTLLIVKDEDIEDLIFTYALYLHLDIGKLMNLLMYSIVCAEYIENFETITTDGEWGKYIQSIGEYQDRYKSLKENPKRWQIIQKGFEYFPAEFAVNCLDKEWAQKKYESFRVYELYNLCKQLQHQMIRRELYWFKEDSPIVLDIGNDDRDARIFLEAETYQDALCEIKWLQSVGFDVPQNKLELFKMPLEEYVHSFPDFGYNQYHAFKYNYLLADKLSYQGYRIDCIEARKDG